MTLVTGGAYFHHADSFAMIRGGHIDICVLGAFQVSVAGDLANWHTGEPDTIPAVGGAMDLAVGARRVFVMMEHLTRKGEPKIVERCTYPLTGVRCVSRIYTDLAVLDVTPAGLAVVDLVDGLSLAELKRVLPRSEAPYNEQTSKATRRRSRGHHRNRGRVWPRRRSETRPGPRPAHDQEQGSFFVGGENKTVTQPGFGPNAPPTAARSPSIRCTSSTRSR